MTVNAQGGATFLSRRNKTDSIHIRSEALLGAEAMRRLAAARVAVVGVGGVGSWCAEALLRTGVGHLVLIDDDMVAPSNVNRQSPATSRTIGRNKVEVLAERLLEIDPGADVEPRYERCLGFAGLENCDAIVDAIDSVACKAELILGATAAGVPIVSSLGAALRTDPTRVAVRRFDKVTGDGLARALRQRFKRIGRWPAVPFECVVSDEPPAAAPTDAKGSVMTVTATFGMVLAARTIALVTA